MEETEVASRSFLSVPGALIVLSLAIPIFARLMFYKQVFITKTRPLRPRKTIRFRDMIIEVTDITRITIRSGSDDVYTSTVGTWIPCHVDCSTQQSENLLEVEFSSYAALKVAYKSKRWNHIKTTRKTGEEEEERINHYYEVSWVLLKERPQLLEDHVDMPGSHWYGGGHQFRQQWPMDKVDTDFAPYVTGEAFPVPASTDYYGGVQERLWFNSAGVAIFVPPEVPLFVSINLDGNKLLRLKATYQSPYRNVSGEKLTLSYKICVSSQKTPLAAYQASAGMFFDVPSGIPDEEMFHYPIWSTWALYKTTVNQEKVIDMAENIKKNSFKACQIEIDDGWAARTGDNLFDKLKFPDPALMMRRLKQLGIRVTLWVTPFASFRSQAFAEGRKHKAWISRDVCNLGLTSRLPAPVSWWNGYSAMLDVTNQGAVEWFREELLTLKAKYGISSFKVDGGEGCRLSSWTRLHADTGNPNEYTRQFAEMVYSLDPDTRSQELRVGVSCQNLPMFFRIHDKDSNWGDFNGLKTVIPNVLAQGLLGYPFVLPDMIGGNSYGLLTSACYNLPDRELYIRWLQLNALLPAMQFSTPPWSYDEEVVRIAKEMCSLHEKAAPLFISLARGAAKTGAPIIRPLWWIAPHDPVALTISTQFLVGDRLLVAPVLEQGARARDVYLPAGVWRDELSNNICQGGRWYRNYPVDIHSLAHFTRADDKEARW